MNLTIRTIFLALVFCGCSTKNALPERTPYIAADRDFIPDVYPMNDSSSTDLQDFALTLPIFETGDGMGWIESGPGAINRADEWKIIADGAQAPVKIQRMESSAEGAQRIKVIIGPTFTSDDGSSALWVHDLERSTGGWKRLRSHKQ
ncbi:MAG: hypothetical protein AB8D78_14345 [Akkermansiaceae bacterium]